MTAVGCRHGRRERGRARRAELVHVREVAVGLRHDDRGAGEGGVRVGSRKRRQPRMNRLIGTIMIILILILILMIIDIFVGDCGCLRQGTGNELFIRIETF